MPMHSHHDVQTQPLEERMLSRGMKPTAMRLLVYRELAQSHHPMSLRELEEKMVTADRSTIFRTLNTLQAHHLVHVIENGSGAVKYEVCHGHSHCTLQDQHAHFYCERCQRVFCLSDMPVPPVSLPEGFRVSTINYMVKGLCPQCAGE